MILKVARLVDVATCLVCVLLGAGAAMVIPLANGFTYTPHAPISIVGNSDFTSVNGVTGGSGTNSDPYIIQGWTISCCQSPRILIRDTTANFVVRDIELTGGGSMTLSNVANGAVEDLPRSSATSLDLVGDRKFLVDNVTGAGTFNVTNSTLVKISRSSGGISISSSNQISVVGNDAESFVVGFRNPFNVVTALRSTQVSISGNRYYTVYLDGSSGVSITNNYLGASCCTTDFTGLRINNSKHVTISRNIFNSDTEVASSGSSSLEIFDNILENSVTGAVVLDSCSNVSLRDNQILGGVDEYPGIARISSCNNMKIVENTFNSPN
ncbi:MAG TPA: right-handed parallel beta-helix repeat-containing protein, partial [Candidatus Bathyarchaeia archaeon]|nr:right-handed parallel beta-helix repeat-containing protein [Candidatus Bathyarchaeia archaeon]